MNVREEETSMPMPLVDYQEFSEMWVRTQNLETEFAVEDPKQLDEIHSTHNAIQISR